VWILSEVKLLNLITRPLNCLNTRNNVVSPSVPVCYHDSHWERSDTGQPLHWVFVSCQVIMQRLFSDVQMSELCFNYCLQYNSWQCEASSHHMLCCVAVCCGGVEYLSWPAMNLKSWSRRRSIITFTPVMCYTSAVLTRPVRYVLLPSSMIAHSLQILYWLYQQKRFENRRRYRHTLTHDEYIFNTFKCLKCTEMKWRNMRTLRSLTLSSHTLPHKFLLACRWVRC